MKALETRYNGYRFRSRLEARWAVFFDSLPEPEIWEYEKEGFDLGGFGYLPDFWLPRLNCYLEIKGATPTQEEIQKARLFRDRTGQAIAIFHGLPTEYFGQLFCFDLSENSGGSSDWDVMLCNDPFDGSLVFGVRGLGGQTKLYAKEIFECEIEAICGTEYMPCVATDIALDRAKAARFEFGETFQ